MENATEALQLAAWVLIFVLALSISMNAFAEARQSIDNILIASDRDYVTSYVEEADSTLRIVGAESIVPTIYRAYKENFKIKFSFLESKSTEPPLYYRISYEDGRRKDIPVYEIDLQKENISDEKAKEYIIKKILFGHPENDTEYERDYIRAKISDKINFSTDNNNSLIVNDGLYNKIKGKNYEERLGIYFQEEINGTTTESMANKTEKKVVTYCNLPES